MTNYASNNVENPAKKLKLEDSARSTKVVQEKDVGIVRYLDGAEANPKGIFGYIKVLYSDFLVNEINKKGEVIHLLDEGIDLGKSKKEKHMEKRSVYRAEFQGKMEEEVEKIKQERKLEEKESSKYELTQENRGKVLEFITPEELQQIEDLFTNGKYMETKTIIGDKTLRTRFHGALREAFQNKLESVTTPDNTFRIAIATNRKNRSRNPQDSINHIDENGVMNYGLGPYRNYLHFTVYKENRETMEVASTLAKFLRIPSRSIRYAGTKDRRGITCQRFCIHRGKVARVSSVNKGLRNIVLGGFAYEDYALGLGDLSGNEFIITIRDVRASNSNEQVEKIIQDSFDSLRNKGFINYYGMQRFGTFSVSTHVVGIHLLREDWRSAVELILSKQEIVAPDSVQAREIWAETSNASLALLKLPTRFTAEYAILNVLANEPYEGDEGYSKHSYFKAVMSIPHNLRKMYVHAYQSYIWNVVVSKRLEMFGMNIKPGDLVLCNHEVGEKGHASISDDSETEDVAVQDYAKVKSITEEDIKEQKYNIFDIVLPSPGFDVTYPINEELKRVYIDVMAQDGLDPFNMARRVREFSLAGSYRKLVSKPTELSYEIVNYKEPLQPLARSDLEILHLKNELKNDDNKNPEVSRVIHHNEGDSEKKAVILKMHLHIGSYATMALREFMKADTARFSDSFNIE